MIGVNFLPPIIIVEGITVLANQEINQRSTELKQEWELRWNPYNNVLQMQRQMT